MERIDGPLGSECYLITHESGSVVTIARQGGHLISWKTADGIERLYLSPEAEFASGKAIRGGVPVIFPQFSDHGPFGRHGFARKSLWIPNLKIGAMQLTSSTATLEDWPHAFALTIRPILSATSLAMELTVTNPGPEPLAFQAALHTYLRVSECKKATVTGLEGLPYQDQATRKTINDDESPVTLGSVTDRAWFGSGNRTVLLHDGTTEISAQSDTFGDVVVWNPGPDHGIGDLPGAGWKDFICIESAQIEPSATIDPGQSWRGVQRLEVLK